MNYRRIIRVMVDRFHYSKFIFCSKLVFSGSGQLITKNNFRSYSLCTYVAGKRSKIVENLDLNSILSFPSTVRF